MSYSKIITQMFFYFNMHFEVTKKFFGKILDLCKYMC